jgi:hypothetical protein
MVASLSVRFTMSHSLTVRRSRLYRYRTPGSQLLLLQSMTGGTVCSPGIDGAILIWSQYPSPTIGVCGAQPSPNLSAQSTGTKSYFHATFDDWGSSINHESGRGCYNVEFAQPAPQAWLRLFLPRLHQDLAVQQVQQ